MSVTSYSPLRRNYTALVLALALASGCAAPDTIVVRRAGTAPTKAKAAPEDQTARQGPVTQKDAGLIEEKAPPPAPAKGYFGRVLGLDGNPAPGVVVVAHLLDGPGGALVSNHGGGLVSNNSGGILSNQGGGIVSNQAGRYGLLAGAPITAQTNPDGTFKLALPDGVRANVEAKQTETVKAIIGDITTASAGFELRLAPTGAIGGKVSVPAGSAVTNLQGVSVFVPGTSYSAFTDKDGNFRIDHMPVGVYRLWASSGRASLGEALSEAVTVKSNETAATGAFVLKVQPVEVSSVDPAITMEGGSVRIKGTNFGKSKGADFKVRLNGQEVEQVAVLSDTEATFVVPASANGPLVVDVEGVKSAQVPFEVAAEWEVEAPTGLLPVGTTFDLKVTPRTAKNKVIKTKDFKPTWTVASGTAAKVDAGGRLTTVGVGQATVVGTFQTHQARFTVQVGNPVASTGPTLGGYANPRLPSLEQAVAAADGTIYVTTESRVLAINAEGVATPLAGNTSDQVKDDIGTLACFEMPTGLALDAANTRLIVGDYNRLRFVSLADATVSTAAGPAWYLDTSVDDKDGVGPAAGINGPDAVAVGTGGVVWFLNENRLRKMDSSGQVTTPNVPTQLIALTPGQPGRVYGLTATGIQEVTASGSLVPVTPQANVSTWSVVPSSLPIGGLARDTQGSFYMADGNQIHKLDALTGQVKVFAGTTGPGPAGAAQRDGDLQEARFQGLHALTFDAPRNRLVLLEDGAVRALDLTAGTVTTLTHRSSGGTSGVLNTTTYKARVPGAEEPEDL